MVPFHEISSRNMVLDASKGLFLRSMYDLRRLLPPLYAVLHETQPRIPFHDKNNQFVDATTFLNLLQDYRDATLKYALVNQKY